MFGRRVPLQDYFEALMREKDLRDQQRFDAQGQALTEALRAADTAVQAALTAAEKAVAKAETATEKRFESVNEFRQTLSDQTAGFPSRVELQALSDRVTDLAARLDKTEGRSGGAASLWGYLIAAAGIALALAALITR